MPADWATVIDLGLRILFYAGPLTSIDFASLLAWGGRLAARTPRAVITLVVAVALLGQAGRLPLANVQLAGGLGFASNADTFGWTRAVRRHQIPVLGLGAALTLFGAATRSRISAFFRFAGRAAGLSEPLIPASLTLIALSTLAVRQSVTPRLNARRDAGLAGDDAGARRFAVGQRISDLINIAQFLIVLAVIVSILSDLG